MCNRMTLIFSINKRKKKLMDILFFVFTVFAIAVVFAVFVFFFSNKLIHYHFRKPTEGNSGNL
jgi:flagellar basal body-associated protein FliL